MKVIILVIAVLLILGGALNLWSRTDRLLLRIIMVIVGIMLIVLIAGGCDSVQDCDLETNYGTTPGEVTACSS
jgi:hypothetical protein